MCQSVNFLMSNQCSILCSKNFFKDGIPYTEAKRSIVKSGGDNIELENGLDLNENEKNLTRVRN